MVKPRIDVQDGAAVLGFAAMEYGVWQLSEPLAWVLAVSLGWGLEGVWWAIVASACLKGVGVTALYLSGRWERAMHRGRELLLET